MLTREKAVHILQNSWSVKDVELELGNDRGKFLNKLIVAAHERVPLQHLSSLKLQFMSPKERRLPTIYEVDEMCMSGSGGGCFHVNAFTSRLLKALGYSAYPCVATVTGLSLAVPHLVVIVKDLVNTGDVHLVDCALGPPTFQAIPLNFREESPIYLDSYLEYKFIKRDGKILRMHGDGDLLKHNDPPLAGVDLILGKWRRYCEFTLEDFERKTSEEIGLFYERIFPTLNLLPKAFRYPGGKAVMIMMDNLFIEDNNRTLKKTKLRSNEEVFQAYQEYFPAIDAELVKHVYTLWQNNRL